MTAATPGVFMQRVRDLVRRPPVTCGAGVRVVELARLMSREEVGSVVVTDDGGRPVGIVTDRDLRRKVVAEARDPSTACAADVMSAPLVTVTPGAFAFDALLEMTRREFHHLPIVDAGRVVGVLSTHDFLATETAHPVHLAAEIARATSIETLRTLAARTTPLVRRLVDAGASAYDVGQLVAELNDRLVVAVLTMTTTALVNSGHGSPPASWAWLVFGSEARREQTLRTDQDNGLVYADPVHGQEAAVAAWFGRFANAAVEDLIAVGFPRCPGEIMASNPKWCQPLSVWRRYFEAWIDEPEPGPVLAAQIHFDLRSIAGDVALGGVLRDIIETKAPTRRLFLGLIARDVVGRRAPLTIFGNVAVERRGPRRGTVDVKAAALPLTGAARLHALELALPATNTIDRFRLAGARGLYTEAETREITDAVQHLTRLRLGRQLEQLERGDPPDNALRPDRLSRADLLLLRDALSTVQRVQAGIRERFKTDAMG